MFWVTQTLSYSKTLPCRVGSLSEVGLPMFQSDDSLQFHYCRMYHLIHFNMNTERKRGDESPKLNPKSHHVMLQFDDDEWMKFLVMYEEQTDVKAKAVLPRHASSASRSRCCVRIRHWWNTTPSFLLFTLQYRMIGNNYNQVVKELRCHFSEKRRWLCSISWRTAPGNWSLLPVRLLN